ncbi:WD40 repeat domain-containing serine/threonine protein kinase [Tautonia plasticadhaerens]|uniref:Serine/threonine-protein kinase PrkC n=1 Tax=Tautonia plasticadhaerens TaxID=2527974 RepID=A0A518HD68_9BACT|nr:protein kinase [Tautonia plasticadhaerens]QDV38805.1 Serine/threonine-protein kinase PrkC [Tautonia plasticadhaerens]
MPAWSEADSSWDDETLILDDPGEREGDPSGGGSSEDAPAPGPGAGAGAGAGEIPDIDPGRRPEWFRTVARIGRQVAQGLAYAHGRGVIHRDIKPSNLLLDGEGIAWITDFGLALAEEDLTLTGTGDLLGTTRYMAPERFRGEGDARADVYALGLTLYELVTLRPAFPAVDRLELIDRIRSQDPPRPRSIDPGIPRDLETIVLKATEKDPAARYQTASAMAEDLGRFLDDRPIEARPIGPIERLARWCRRNPEQAVLGGAVLGLLVAIALVSTTLAVRLDRRAREARDAARAADLGQRAALRAAANEAVARRDADRASLRLARTRDELRRNLYAARIATALAAWDANDVGRLEGLLEQARRQAEGLDLLGWEWHYLHRLSRQERATFRDHSREVSRVAFSPDGLTLASIQWGGRVVLRDPATGAVRGELPGSDDPRFSGPLSLGVSALAFSPDGLTLAAQGPDLGVAAFEVDSGRRRFSVEQPAEPPGPPVAVLDLAFSPDGLMLAAATAAHSILIWDARDGRLLRHLPNAHAGPVADVEFSPDGLTLASAGFDGLIAFRDARAPAEGSSEGEGEGEGEAILLPAHVGAIRDLVYSPDGLTLASAGADGTVRLWDPVGRRELDRLRPDCPDVAALAYAPDGSTLASAGIHHEVTLWDAESGRPLRSLKGHTDSIYALAYSPDGRTIASAGADTTVRLWDPERSSQPRTLIEPGPASFFDRPFALDFSRDGLRVAAGFEDATVLVWGLPDADRRLEFATVGPGDPRLGWSIYSLAFSPDGLTLAVGDPDHRVTLRDAGTGALLRVLGTHDDTIKDLAFSPDGRSVASASNDGRLTLWDLEAGAARFTYEGQDLGVLDLDFSPDGRSIASASNNQTVAILDASTGDVRRTLDGHLGSVLGVSWSPDGRTIASAGADTTVRLWEAETGRPLRVLTGHTSAVQSVCFSPDGRRLASAGSGRTIRLWDPSSGLELLALKDHDGWIRRIAFSPDGLRLVSVSDDGTVKLRDAFPLDPSAGPPEPTESGSPDQPPGGMVSDVASSAPTAPAGPQGAPPGPGSGAGPGSEAPRAISRK